MAPTNVPSETHGRQLRDRKKKNSRLSKIDKKKRIQQQNQPTPKDKIAIAGLTCPICYETLVMGEMSSTICGHIFCTACLHNVLKKTRRCPTCRMGLNGPRAHHRLFLNDVINDAKVVFTAPLDCVEDSDIIL